RKPSRKKAPTPAPAPDPEWLKRLEEESALMNHRFDDWSPEPPTSLGLRTPVKGRITGNFGLRRFYEGKERSAHKGIDIAAPIGTPIHPAAPGRVSLVGNFILTGRT